MNCTQTRKQLKFGYPSIPALREKMEAHARQCCACHEEIAVERLTASLVRSFAAPDTDEADAAPYSEQRLVYRTMARIREIKERGASSWPRAVIAIRGWLFGFGAAALLLLALSIWGQPPPVTRIVQEEIALDLTLAPSKDLLLSPPWFDQLDEEDDYVHR